MFSMFLISLRLSPGRGDDEDNSNDGKAAVTVIGSALMIGISGGIVVADAAAGGEDDEVSGEAAPLCGGDTGGLCWLCAAADSGRDELRDLKADALPQSPEGELIGALTGGEERGGEPSSG